MPKIEQALDSREVAEMVKKNHKELLRDIRRYCTQFNESNIAPVDFFKESTYIDGKGEPRPCYLITKKGCEFIAHKLTGIKGTIFTARYINRFHEMEDMLTGDKPEQEKPWFVRKFKGRDIILERDFITITGVDIRNRKPFYHPDYFVAGGDWNGSASIYTIDPEQFLLEHGFEYGTDEVMIYLYPSGVRKALKILQADKQISLRAGAEEILLNGIAQPKPARQCIKQMNPEQVAYLGEEPKRKQTILISVALDNDKAELRIV